jgi:hypothetical protein
MDANQHWEIREITGQEDVDGVPHYLEWCPTLIPKDSMRHATELVADFEARLTRIQARLGPREAKRTTGFEARQA